VLLKPSHLFASKELPFQRVKVRFFLVGFLIIDRGESETLNALN
jgi:hypothetical protein